MHSNCSQAECSSFIDTLFTVIRTKSYLPYQAVQESPSFPTKSLDQGIPIPLDALLTPTSTSPDRTRKRSTTDDERDGRPPAKGPRLNTDGQFSRYGNVGNGADGRMGPHSSGGWTRPPFRDGTMGMGMGMGMGPYAGPMSGMGMGGMGMMNGRRPQGYQPPDQKRGICRDYHSKFSFFCATYVCLMSFCRQRLLCARCDVQIQPWG
jgi:RNA-binding protein 26